MIGVRAEQPHVLGARVATCVHVIVCFVTSLERVRMPASSSRVRSRLHVSHRARQVRRVSSVHRVVGAAERRRPIRAAVFQNNATVPPGTQRRGHLVVAICSVHPVPRLRGDTPTGTPRARARPLLERRHFAVDALGAQHRGHARRSVRARARARPRSRKPVVALPGAGADLERAITGREIAELDDGVEHAVGIRRPGGVVLLGDLAEDEACSRCGSPDVTRSAVLVRGASLFTRSKMRAVQPAISTGGKQLVDDAAGDLGAARPPRAASGCASTTGLPTSPPSDTAGSIGTSPTSGAPVSAASRLPPPDPKIACREPSGATNSLMFSTTPSTLRYERRAMSATRAATFCAPFGRRRDDEHLGLREQPGERHLDVAGAGRHVDEQVVEVAPLHVDEELLERLGEDQAAPHRARCPRRRRAGPSTRPSSGRRRATSTSFGRILPVPSALLRRPRGGRCTPSMRGIEKPQMSASSTPTVKPARRERGREVRGDRRLADAALAAADRDDTRRRGHLGRRRRLRRAQPRLLHDGRALLLGHLVVLDVDLVDARAGRRPSSARRCRSGRAAGRPAVVSATLDDHVAVGSTSTSRDHAEVDDRGVELGIEHAREDAADVVGRGERRGRHGSHAVIKPV